MNMNRRGFLGSILALGAAPAIVRADSLMRIVPMDAAILLPGAVTLTGDRLVSLVEITREALRLCHEKAEYLSRLERQYDGSLSKFRQGGTIRVSRPR